MGDVMRSMHEMRQNSMRGADTYNDVCGWIAYLHVAVLPQLYELCERAGVHVVRSLVNLYGSDKTYYAIRKYMSKVSERFLTCCFACTLGFRINAPAAGDWGFFDTRKCRFRYKISLYIGSKTPRECLCVPAPPVRR